MKLKIKIRICELRVKAKYLNLLNAYLTITFNNSVIPILTAGASVEPLAKVMRRKPDKMQKWSGFREPKKFPEHPPPKPVCLPYYIYVCHSSNVAGGSYPPTTFSGKGYLEL